VLDDFWKSQGILISISMVLKLRFKNIRKRIIHIEVLSEKKDGCVWSKIWR
jgi:hypothetical protein